MPAAQQSSKKVDSAALSSLSSSSSSSSANHQSSSIMNSSSTVNKRAALKDRLFQHIEKFFHLHPHQIDSTLITELSQILRSENVGKEDVLHFFLSLFELCMREESIQKTTSLVVGLKKKSEHGILSVLDSTLISTLCTTLLASVVTSHVQQEINLFSPEELYKLLKQKQQQQSSSTNEVFEQQVKVRLVFVTGCFLSGAVFCWHQPQGKKDQKSRPFYLRLIEDVQTDYRRLLKKLKAVSEEKERQQNEHMNDSSEPQNNEQEEQQHHLAILNVLFVEAFGVILSCMKQQSQKKHSVVSRKDLETFAFELERSFLPEIVDNTPSLLNNDGNNDDSSERKKKSLKDRTVVTDGAFIRNMLQSTYVELPHFMLHHYIQQYCPTAIHERNMIMTGGNASNSEDEDMNENSILMTRSFVIALCNYMADFRHLPVQCAMTQFLTNLIVPSLALGMKKKKKQTTDASKEYEQFLFAKELLQSFFSQLFSQMQVPPSPLQQPKSGSTNDIIAQLSTRKGYWWEIQIFQDVIECLNNVDKNVMNYILDEILPLGEIEKSVNPFLLMWGACLNECKQFLKNAPSLTSSSPTGNNTLLNSLLMLVVKKQEQKKRKRAESGEENVNSETESIKNELKMKQVREAFFNYQIWLGSYLRPRILSLTSTNPSLSKILLSRESVLCKVSNTLGRYTTDNGKLSSFTLEADKKKKRNDDEDEFTSSSRKTTRSLIRTLSSWLRDAIKLRVGTITRSILMILEQYDEQMERFIAKKNQMDLVHDSLAQEEEKEEEWLNEEALRFLLSCFPTNVRVYDKSEDSFTADNLLVLLKKLFEVGSMMNYVNEKLLSAKKKEGLSEREILIRQKSYYGKDIIDMSSNLVKVILNNLAVQEFNWMRHQYHPSSKESSNEKAQLTGSKPWSGEIYSYAITLYGLDGEKKTKQETRKRIFDTTDNNATLFKIQNLLSKIQKELEKISIGSSSKTCMDWTILSSLAIYLKQLIIASMFDPWIIESQEQGKPMVEDLLKVYESLSSLSSEELVTLCQKKEDSMQDEDATQPTEVLTDLLVVNINAEPNLTLASRIVFMTLAKFLNEECLDLLFNYLMNDGEVDEIDEEDESDEEEEEDSDEEEEEEKAENIEEEHPQNGEENALTQEDTEGAAIIRNDEEDEEGGIDLNNPSDVSRVLEILKARNEAKRRKSEEKQKKLKRMEFAMNIVQVLEGLCIKSVPQPVLVLLLFKGTQYVLDKLWYQNTEDVADHLKKATGYAVNTIFNKVFQLVMILTKEYRQQLLSDASNSPCAIVFDQDAKEALFETAKIYAIEFSKYGKYLSSIQGKAKRAVLAKSLAPTLNMEQCAHMLSIYIRLMSLLRSGSNKVVESAELDIEKILFGSEKSSMIEENEEDNLGTSMELLISLSQSDPAIACTLSSKIITFALEKIIHSGDKKYRNKKSGFILAQPQQRELYDRILVHLVKPYLATLTENQPSQVNKVLFMVLDAYVKDICPAMKVNRTVKSKALKKCASILLNVLEYLANHSTKQDDFTDTQFKELIICFYFVFYHSDKKEKKSEEKSVWSQALPLFEAWRKRWNLLSDVESIQQNVIEATQDLDKTAIEILKQRRETFKNERKERVKQQQEILRQQQEEDNKKKRKRNEKTSSSSASASNEPTTLQDEVVNENKKNASQEKAAQKETNESSTKKRKTTPTAFAFTSDEAPAETIEEMKKKSGVIPVTAKTTSQSNNASQVSTTQTSKKPQKASFMKETASSAAKKAAIAETKKPQLASSKKVKK